MNDSIRNKMARAAAGRQAFDRMSAGEQGCGPGWFVRTMVHLGLTPEDIGRTEEEVAAAKRRCVLKFSLAAMREGDPRSSPGKLDYQMNKLNITPADLGTSAEEIQAAKKQWAAVTAKAALAKLSEGDPDVGPEGLDNLMHAFGLEPRDIDASPEEIQAVKRRWRVGQGKQALEAMLSGVSYAGSEAFDCAMAHLGLTPEDIDTTSEGIAAAKRQWEVMQGKHALHSVLAGDVFAGPDAFDRTMAKWGLTPEDIDATTEEIEDAKRRWVPPQRLF